LPQPDGPKSAMRTKPVSFIARVNMSVSLKCNIIFAYSDTVLLSNQRSSWIL
jgi:hypothetical protein